MTTKSGEKLLYEDITYQIRGACFEVWQAFGGAFKEKVIDRALTRALRKRNLSVDDQKRIPVFFDEEKVGEYVPDKIVEGCVLIELKCKPFLTREDERQFWLYLKGSNYKVGLLINFGSDRLQIKRRVLDRARNYPR